MTTFTYDNPNGKGTNTVTYAQNKDGSWTVVSNYYYNCSGSSYGSSSTGGGGGSCGNYSSSSTKSGTGSTGKTNGGTGSTTTTSTGSGTCGGTGTKTNDGGTTTPSIPTSGSFGQITDGSYADLLTMQYYSNKYPKAKNDYEITQIFNLDNSMNGNKNCFSKKGCLMTAIAKIASEITGKEIDLLEINQKVDTDKNGELSIDEISNGLNNILDTILGDIYDVSVKDIRNVKQSDLENNVSFTTFVLGFAPDCYNGHWVVLEGYNADTTGKVTFSYDGTSNNDFGRTYILGTANQNTDNKVYGIDRIETITITSKTN